MVLDTSAPCFPTHVSDKALVELRAVLNKADPESADTGSETGGLLLGIGGAETRIEGAQPVAIEHRFGPNFWLSSSDIENWKRTIREFAGRGECGVIGHFRTLKSAEPETSDVDHAIAGLMPVSEPLAMLIPIGPEPVGDAAILRRVDGTWVEVRRLRLGHRASGGPAPTPAATLSTAPSPLQQESSEPVPVEARVKPRPAQLRLWTLVALVVMVTAAIILAGFMLWRRPAIVVSSGPLGLSARVTEGGLILSWNRSSSALQQSQSGTLTVRDGGILQQILFNRDELLRGSVLYMPRSGKVDFRLEVSSSSGYHNDEFLAVVTASTPASESTGSFQPIPEPPKPQSQPESLPSPAITNPQRVLAKTSAAFAPGAPPVADDRDRTGALHSENLRIPLSEPLASAGKTEIPAVPAILTPVLVPGGQAPEVAPGSAAELVAPINFIGPVPVRRVRPTLPIQLQSLADSKVSIDVRVEINAAGDVTQATPVETATAAQRLLAPQAVQAARQWKFQPARKNGQPVETESILRFDFGRR